MFPVTLLSESIITAAVVTFITQGFTWLRAYVHAVYKYRTDTAKSSLDRIQDKGDEITLAVSVLTERLQATEEKLSRRDAEVTRLNELHIRLSQKMAVYSIQIALAQTMLAVHKEKIPDVRLPDEIRFNNGESS